MEAGSSPREHREKKVEPLPVDYVLGPNDILCGRGKKCFEHVGNRNFRKIVEATLNHYTSAPTKLEKSCIVRAVMDYMCSKSEGGFIRYDPLSNHYFKVSENVAVSEHKINASADIHAVSIVLRSDYTQICFKTLRLLAFLREKKPLKLFEMR